MKKIILISISIVALVVFLVWAYIASSQPLPGEAKLQPGREHHPEGTKLTYNFNPPTSGDHYPSWVTKGVYDTPRPDGNVVHSMEHGYVVMWYDCQASPSASLYLPFIKQAFAQDTPVPMTTGGEGSASASLTDLPEAYRSPQCDELKKQVNSLYDKVGHHKIVGVPRVGMGKQLVLTAWGKTMDVKPTDADKVRSFVDAYRDHGPESTNEP